MNKEKGQSIGEFAAMMGVFAVATVTAAAVAYSPFGEVGKSYTITQLDSHTLRVIPKDASGTEGYLAGVDEVLKNNICKITGMEKIENFVDIEVQDSDCIGR